MSRLPSLLLASLAAISALVTPAGPLPAATAPTQREIRDYASALFEILSVKRMAELRWRSAAPAERTALRQQAATAIDGILARHGFDEASFNRLSADVERQPTLRRQVRQLMMREGLGY